MNNMKNNNLKHPELKLYTIYNKKIIYLMYYKRFVFISDDVTY